MIRASFNLLLFDDQSQMVILPYAKNLLFYVFAGSRGGYNRIKIIESLKTTPKNANQLTNDLNLNYRAIQHHLEVLEKNNLITKVGDKYGANYFLSVFLESNIDAYNEIVSKSKEGKAQDLHSILKNVFMLLQQNAAIMPSYDDLAPQNDYFVSKNIENTTRPDLSYAKHLLWMVFAASRGGQNRIRIVFELKRSPRNAHQLAKELELNYRAIQHHLHVLETNNLISHIGQKYGTNYFLSPLLDTNMKAFDDLVLNLSRGKHDRKGVYLK